MKLARYYKGGKIRIEDAPVPKIADGEVLVKTKASGLCSGELMGWYMDRKAPHILGHEVSGEVVESKNDQFPIGTLVAPHHHTNCGVCDECTRGAEVHCNQWKMTALDPGGMAEFFRIPRANLSETAIVTDLQPEDAALLEPTACVCKSISRAAIKGDERICVIGLGVFGRMHLLMLVHHLGLHPYPRELLPERLEWMARELRASGFEPAPSSYDVVFVMPGTPHALKEAARLAASGGRIIMFAPLPPGVANRLDFSDLYFRDISLIPSYSCGASNITEALTILRNGVISAAKIGATLISLQQLPSAYQEVKKSKLIKATVMF